MNYFKITPYTHSLKKDKELTSFHDNVDGYLEQIKRLIENYKNLMGVHIKYLNNETYECHDYYLGINELKKVLEYQEKLQNEI